MFDPDPDDGPEGAVPGQPHWRWLRHVGGSEEPFDAGDRALGLRRAEEGKGDVPSSRRLPAHVGRWALICAPDPLQLGDKRGSGGRIRPQRDEQARQGAGGPLLPLGHDRASAAAAMSASLRTVLTLRIVTCL